MIDAVNGNESPMDRAYAAYVRAKYNTFDFNRNKHKLYAAEARDSLKIGEGQRLTFGAEYMRDKVSGTNLGANGDQAGSITVNGVVKAAPKKKLTPMRLTSRMRSPMENGLSYRLSAMIITEHSAVMVLQNWGSLTM